MLQIFTLFFFSVGTLFSGNYHLSFSNLLIGDYYSFPSCSADCDPHFQRHLELSHYRNASILLQNYHYPSVRYMCKGMSMLQTALCKHGKEKEGLVIAPLVSFSILDCILIFRIVSALLCSNDHHFFSPTHLPTHPLIHLDYCRHLCEVSRENIQGACKLTEECHAATGIPRRFCSGALA